MKIGKDIKKTRVIGGKKKITGRRKSKEKRNELLFYTS